eukprot:2286732-Pleurochrysis_carterae.AAC.1
MNVRACHDLVAGIDGRPQRCTAIGDLPICAMDESGKLVHVTLRNVRCAPSFNDSLLSVNALWESSSTECRFADVKAIISPPTSGGDKACSPFQTLGQTV